MNRIDWMWLSLVKACPEIGALFTPDDRQEWMCPECGNVAGKNIVFTAKWCQECGKENRQPIPRLDQLVGMMKSGYVDFGKRTVKETHFYFLGQPYDYDESRPYYIANTLEEAVVQGIANEHGLKYTGKEGEPWERVDRPTGRG